MEGALRAQQSAKTRPVRLLRAHRGWRGDRQVSHTAKDIGVHGVLLEPPGPFVSSSTPLTLGILGAFPPS